jgi:uncharacterized protein
MSLKETINQDIKTAMLAKEKDTLRALRSIKAMILLAESEKGQEGELTKEKEFAILSKAAKQRKESVEIFTQQKREDLAAVEQLEYHIIKKYLPSMMTDEEVERRLKGIIETSGMSSMSDMGKVIGLAMKEMQGKAEGKLISDTVKKLLG